MKDKDAVDFETDLHDIIADALEAEYNRKEFIGWDDAEEAFLIEDTETGKRYYVSYYEKKEY